MATHPSLSELRIRGFEKQLLDGRGSDLPVRVAAVSLGRGHPTPLSAAAGLQAQSGRTSNRESIFPLLMSTTLCASASTAIY